MHKLGISVYPEHASEEENFAYMELAAKYGFSRIFTCLLSVKESREEIIQTFTTFMKKAHELGFVVAVDTNPDVFKYLGVTPLDLTLFSQIGIDIIRLDGHFGDREDIAITHNPFNIQIEFNGSSNTALDLMIERGADAHNMIVCHNFYPQKYSGLSWEIFVKFTNKYKKLGLRMAAFVSSNNRGTFGPWPVNYGLPTCEMHRGKPIDFQARHLLATQKIDDILIGNAFATEDELSALAAINTTKITIRLTEESDLQTVEQDILNNYLHFDRQDVSEYFVRSSIAREDFKNRHIPQRFCTKKVFQRGDVVIVNDQLAHYRGELQIIKRDIKNEGHYNYIGYIPEEEFPILDILLPEYIFGFVK